MPVSNYPTFPPAECHPVQAWNSPAALRECLGRMDPELDFESSTARAALILLAGLRMEHNVVKVANFTGLSVEFVARCVRRLVDNGVWRSGETLCSWRIGSGDQAAFWADVAVAEGKLCRRLDESGRAEWAPGGHWWKSFDLVRPSEAERLEQSVLYYSPPPAPPAEPMPLRIDEDGWDEDDSSDLTVTKSVTITESPFETEGWTPPKHEAVEPPPPPVARDPQPELEMKPEPRAEAVDLARERESKALPSPAGGVETHSGKSVPELFPGAVWL